MQVGIETVINNAWVHINRGYYVIPSRITPGKVFVNSPNNPFKSKIIE